ncbi:ABC transporter permease [Candidatus Gottesmanbacteria bacterium]|nr:ABC transporter permease [Candidatus Gottesmanbacteria bacterium]
MEIKEITIVPKSSQSLLNISEIWRFRELFFVFVWRDLKVRYKQTILGILWVIFQPLVTMLIFTVLFGNVAKIPSGNLPYTLFVLCGIVYWSFYSTALSESIDSIIGNQSIIKKIYFPKIILIIASVITRFVDFLINFAILLIVAVFLGYIPHLWSVIPFLLALLISSTLAAGLGLILSSLNVKFRDVRYILPFFIQISFYVTPVVYPMAILSERNRFIMSFNPMAIVIELVRWPFSGTTVITLSQIVFAIFFAFVVFIIGLWYFNKTQQYFADIV